MFKRIKLEEIIDFSLSKTNSSSFTKSFINSHKGNTPVYGASLDEEEVSYGYVQDNLDGIRYFENCLTWNIDGSLGIFYRKGYFSLSEKVIPLYVFSNISEQIDLDYLKYVIRFSGDYKRFGFNNKAGKGKLKNLEIVIPVLEDGTYDIDKQKELAIKYRDIESKKIILLSRIERLKKIIIKFDDIYTGFTKIELNKMITHHNGNAAYTKDYCQKHKGSIPVFSANIDLPIGYMDIADYSGEFLTYSKNGCAGYITIKKGDFSVNGDRCVITLNDGYEDIDLYYLKYYLEPLFRANIKGRMGINGKNEYTKINSTMIKKLDLKIPVPISKDGSFDLEKQKEIAHKYATIESIKQDLYNQVLRLINIVVE